MPRQSTSDKVLARLPKGWQEKLLTLYSEGASDAEVQGEMKLHINLWRELLSDEEFNKIVQYGRQLSKAFWYSLPRKNLFNKEFNATLYKTYMANLYAWSDKQSVSETDSPFEANLNDDELLQKISQKLKVVK